MQLIVEPQDVVVEQGAQARLDCVAKKSSLGEPVIQWRTDDGQLISFIGDSFRFASHPSKTNAIIYRITVKNIHI